MSGKNRWDKKVMKIAERGFTGDIQRFPDYYIAPNK